MLNDIIFVSENVAIVQSQESSCLIPSTISVQELSTLYGTVSLPIAQSEAIVEDQFTSIKLVFGSWIESGDEETQLEELYRSRLIFPFI
ncbi:MAG: hypothetical protein A3I04_05640 [Nitrospinae bacterium RIFCSPLOWO2_02_FULL_39_110]|nr:MAG: hypothetical protein A2W53_06410 [Nitrospinae bacterium RIFCSPHIGHO2_02_39_11]OGV99840.1 MAG: hypothetical protein A3D97_04010 [Nitrospinae bacterium RIFCSPHIGHO2_12_FULL_39_42]OGV99872.1 MAG: hypothetical protein A3D20_05435 [Nitrospinae bacterium RIFCSPHIGHO2_02_FULL_39_82]OGW02904.1 MAG: hypothetical protein A2Z59_03450 [Nitrospinae bacterium RIFCSPLOWO2_02_39_17]OGW05863.1 MAG: hypothetical protein A3I04_05640 [Nitrospinae bacterium RIFCSPLOWO2_02_FULL_39_110]OGW11379.1 MAG: hypoth